MGREKKNPANAFSGGNLCISVPSWGQIQNSKRRERDKSSFLWGESVRVCVCLPACVWQRSTRGLLPPLPALVFSPLGCCAKTIFCLGPFFSTLAKKTAATGGRTGQAGASRKHSRVPSRLRWLTWILRTLWSLCLKAPFNLNVPTLYPFSDLYLTCLCLLEQACMLHCLKEKNNCTDFQKREYLALCLQPL